MSWSIAGGTRFPPIDGWRRLTVGVDHLTQLLIAARDGDHAALERFIVETQRDVWKLCRYLGDPDTADDLAQETFERAIGSLHRYRADGPARHWILTIARRVCVDSTRRRRRVRRLQRRLADQPSTQLTEGAMPSEIVRARRPARPARSRSAGRVRHHPGARAALRRGCRSARLSDRHDPFTRCTGAGRPGRVPRRARLDRGHGLIGNS